MEGNYFITLWWFCHTSTWIGNMYTCPYWSRFDLQCCMLTSILKSRDIANKGPSSQGYGFSSSHVWMWELGHKKTWVLKNWCFWTVVLEKTLESPLDCKEIQPVHPKGNQSWLFIGRNDAKAETPVLWPPHAKSWLIWKDLDAEKDWRQEEKGMTKDKMVGWYHRLNGHEWVNSRSWWWSGRPGILQSMGSQRVPHAWVTELNWTGPDLPAGLGESPGEAGGCHSLWGHSITGKRQRSYWLISINTTPGPAQQSAVHVLVLGLKPNNLKGQTQPRPSADTPLDMWGLHMWAKLQLHPPGTGTRSKKLGSTTQVTWDLLGPVYAH